MFRIFFFISFIFSLSIRGSFAQSSFKCEAQDAKFSFVQMESAQDYDGFSADDEWSRTFTSNEVYQKVVSVKSETEYLFIMATEKNVDATSIEIRDVFGNQIDYQTKIKDMNNNEIICGYVADIDEDLIVFFRLINSHKASTCAYLGILSHEHSYGGK